VFETLSGVSRLESVALCLHQLGAGMSTGGRAGGIGDADAEVGEEEELAEDSGGRWEVIKSGCFR
jgi:hypothetical protein